MKRLLERRRSIASPMLMVTILASFASPATAAGFTDFFNNILNEFNSVKQPLALIGIMLVGFGWIFNFVDLRRAGWLVGGVVLIYAATEILNMITG